MLFLQPLATSSQRSLEWPGGFHLDGNQRAAANFQRLPDIVNLIARDKYAAKVVSPRPVRPRDVAVLENFS